MAMLGNLEHRPIQAFEASHGGFHAAHSAAAHSPLIEIAPAESSDAPAALGFALAWLQAGALAQDGVLLWAAPEHSFAEHGAPYAEGLAQFGIDPRKLVLVRTQNQLDALWVSEQALSLPCAHVLCTIAHSAKSLSLTASRRLLLQAEKSGARCVLLRFDPLTPSAARSRWRVKAAPSDHAVGTREIGAPSFHVLLDRNRAGFATQSWRMDWNAHEHRFQETPHAGYRMQPEGTANDSTGNPLDGGAFAALIH